jgi:hypothetical protein
MSLRAAIQALQVEVSDFRQGTAQAPKEGSQDWWLLRAKSLGLSSLKRAEQMALENNAKGGERFFGSCSRLLKHETSEE